MDNKKMHYGFVMVAAIFIEMLVCAGILFGASGVFMTPVSTALGIGTASFSMYLTIQSFAQAITVVIAPKLLGKFSYKSLNAVAAVLAGVGFAMMGFAKGVVVLYVGGALIGVGIVFLTYLTSGTLLPRWFNTKLGTMMAIATSGLGLGGVLFNPIASALVNSNGLFGFNEGWRSAYVLLGALIIVICLPIALFVLKERPEDKGLLPYGYEASEETAGKKILSGVSKSVAVKSSSFIWYVVMVVSFTLPSSILQFFPAVAGSSLALETASFDLVGVIGSVASVGALIGGFILGAANDKVGGHGGCLVGGALGAVGCIVVLSGGSSAAMLLGGAALFGVFYQLNMVQMPAIVQTLYGERDYDKIFPVAAAFSPWVGAVSYTLWGFLHDTSGSYTPMLIIGAALAALTAVAGLLAVASSKKLPRETVEID